MAMNWDVFIAHASDDLTAAQALYDALVPSCRVYLDLKELHPGDEFDVQLHQAQQSSLITVILVSHHAQEAYYEREEIASAIDQSRQPKGHHRVIPVYIDNTSPADAPYGLKLKQGLVVGPPAGLEMSEAALEILAEVQRATALLRLDSTPTTSAQTGGQLPLTLQASFFSRFAGDEIYVAPAIPKSHEARFRSHTHMDQQSTLLALVPPTAPSLTKALVPGYTLLGSATYYGFTRTELYILENLSHRQMKRIPYDDLEKWNAISVHYNYIVLRRGLHKLEVSGPHRLVELMETLMLRISSS